MSQAQIRVRQNPENYTEKSVEIVRLQLAHIVKQEEYENTDMQ